MGRALGSFGIYGFPIHKLGGLWLTVVFGGFAGSGLHGCGVQDSRGFRV